MGLLSCLWSAVPFVAMITVECTDVGMSTVSKAAMTNGMSSFVFPVYYNALGTIIVLPFVVSRRKRAPFTFSILCRLFLLGIIGSLAQILAFTGIKYSSPTLSSALGNLVPIFTFLLAIIFRMEKLDLRSSTGVAICMGALVSVSGALIVTLYKGQQILMASSSLSDFPLHLLHSQQSNWVFGGLLLVIAFLLSAMCNILTTAIVKEFPEKTTIVFFLCFFSTILVGIFTLIVERNPNAWTLKPDIEMVAILYSAIFGGVFHNSVHAWCLQDKGPIYVSMFRPLGIAIAVVMGIIFLGETLYTGSVIGAIIATLGFYTVMWGKSKEQILILNNGVDDLESYSQRTSLLQNNPKEDT